MPAKLYYDRTDRSLRNAGCSYFWVFFAGNCVLAALLLMSPLTVNVWLSEWQWVNKNIQRTSCWTFSKSWASVSQQEEGLRKKLWVKTSRSRGKGNYIQIEICDLQLGTYRPVEKNLKTIHIEGRVCTLQGIASHTTV